MEVEGPAPWPHPAPGEASVLRLELGCLESPGCVWPAGPTARAPGNLTALSGACGAGPAGRVTQPRPELTTGKPASPANPSGPQCLSLTATAETGEGTLWQPCSPRGSGSPSPPWGIAVDPGRHPGAKGTRRVNPTPWPHFADRQPSPAQGSDLKHPGHTSDSGEHGGQELRRGGGGEVPAPWEQRRGDTLGTQSAR